MREFFQGWRRKSGFACLVMVIVLSCLWMRTRFYSDSVRFAVGDRVHVIGSRHGGLAWTSIEGKADDIDWETRAEPREPLGDYLDGWADSLERFNPSYRFVMYWWLIWPLSLLTIHCLFGVHPAPGDSSETGIGLNLSDFRNVRL